jgi:aspartate/methionine/tyrosine aminotransferase
MGVDTSFERFAAERVDQERQFAEEVATLYGVEPENIVATSGASEAIFLVYSVLGSGCRAVVPLPNYGPMFTVPEALGMKVGNNLSTAGRTIFGLTDPNNPTGREVDAETLKTLTAPSRKEGRTIFINETYKEFAFPGHPQTHFGRAANVVVCSTMTKFYGLGRLRVGWIMADRSTVRRLLYAKWAVSGHDSDYSLWIAAQVLRKRQGFVERARSIVSRNIRLVRRFIAETDGVSAELGAAPFCLVHYKRGPGSVALAKALLKATGVLVAPGDFFGAPRTFRICYTTGEEALESGLDKLSSFLKRPPLSTERAHAERMFRGAEALLRMSDRRGVCPLQLAPIFIRHPPVD